MATRLEACKIDATNTDELQNQLRALLRILRPQWDLQRLRFKHFTKGITNKVVCVENADDGERLIVRIYGIGTENIIDRKQELDFFELLSRYQIAPKVHARFSNGIVCGYMPGEPLNVETVRRADIVPYICKKLAIMHRIPVDKSKTSFLFYKLDQFYENLPKSYLNELQQRVFEENFKDVDFKHNVQGLKTCFKSVKNDCIVLCHNDLLVHNLLYDSEHDIINIIDYEYTAVSYQLFDIANHFNEYAGVEELDFSLCPDDNQKRLFLTHYLHAYLDRSPSADEIDHMLHEVPLFQAASHLFWCLWALIQANISANDFDYMNYAAKRYEQFKLFENIITCTSA